MDRTSTHNPSTSASAMLLPIPLRVIAGAIAQLLVVVSTDAFSFSSVAAFSLLGKKQQHQRHRRQRQHSTSHLYRQSIRQSQRLNEDDKDAFSYQSSTCFHRNDDDATIPLLSAPIERRTPKPIAIDHTTATLPDAQRRMPTFWKALLPKMAKPVSLSTAPFQKLKLGLLVSMLIVFGVNWNGDNSIFSASPPVAWAAPPIAVIAEELGYFPITSGSVGMNGKTTTTGGGTGTASASTTVYVSAPVKRMSTPQAVDLADYMQQHDIYMAGTYWCPHTRRQKELLGRQATSRITYIECAPLGYQAQPRLCQEWGVEAYPTWIVPREILVSAATSRDGLTSNSALKSGKDDQPGSSSPSPTVVLIPGERSLADLAVRIGYTGQFSGSIENSSNPPPVLGSNSACQ